MLPNDVLVRDTIKTLVHSVYPTARVVYATLQGKAEFNGVTVPSVEDVARSNGSSSLSFSGFLSTTAREGVWSSEAPPTAPFSASAVQHQHRSRLCHNRIGTPMPYLHAIVYLGGYERVDMKRVVAAKFLEAVQTSIPPKHIVSGLILSDGKKKKRDAESEEMKKKDCSPHSSLPHSQFVSFSLSSSFGSVERTVSAPDGVPPARSAADVRSCRRLPSYLRRHQLHAELGGEDIPYPHPKSPQQNSMKKRQEREKREGIGREGSGGESCRERRSFRIFPEDQHPTPNPPKEEKEEEEEKEQDSPWCGRSRYLGGDVLELVVPEHWFTTTSRFSPLAKQIKGEDVNGNNTSQDRNKMDGIEPKHMSATHSVMDYAYGATTTATTTSLHRTASYPFSTSRGACGTYASSFFPNNWRKTPARSRKKDRLEALAFKGAEESPPRCGTTRTCNGATHNRVFPPTTRTTAPKTATTTTTTVIVVGEATRDSAVAAHSPFIEPHDLDLSPSTTPVGMRRGRGETHHSSKSSHSWRKVYLSFASTDVTLSQLVLEPSSSRRDTLRSAFGVSWPLIERYTTPKSCLSAVYQLREWEIHQHGRRRGEGEVQDKGNGLGYYCNGSMNRKGPHGGIGSEFLTDCLYWLSAVMHMLHIMDPANTADTTTMTTTTTTTTTTTSTNVLCAVSELRQALSHDTKRSSNATCPGSHTSGLPRFVSEMLNYLAVSLGLLVDDNPQPCTSLVSGDHIRAIDNVLAVPYKIRLHFYARLKEAVKKCTVVWRTTNEKQEEVHEDHFFMSPISETQREEREEETVGEKFKYASESDEKKVGPLKESDVATCGALSTLYMMLLAEPLPPSSCTSWNVDFGQYTSPHFSNTLSPRTSSPSPPYNAAPSSNGKKKYPFCFWGQNYFLPEEHFDRLVDHLVWCERKAKTRRHAVDKCRRRMKDKELKDGEQIASRDGEEEEVRGNTGGDVIYCWNSSSCPFTKERVEETHRGALNVDTTIVDSSSVMVNDMTSTAYPHTLLFNPYWHSFLIFRLEKETKEFYKEVTK